MTDYAQGCRKAFFPFALSRAAAAERTRCRVRGLSSAVAAIASSLLQQRLHAHHHVVDAFVRDMS